MAAGAVLTPNKTVPSGQIWAGNPAKYLRDLDADETEFILQSATNYTALAAVHSAENSKTFEEVEVGCYTTRAAISPVSDVSRSSNEVLCW